MRPQEEKREIMAAVAALRAEQPEAVPEPLVAALGYGLAAHHAGCLPAWKSLIERCFQCGEPSGRPWQGRADDWPSTLVKQER